MEGPYSHGQSLDLYYCFGYFAAPRESEIRVASGLKIGGKERREKLEVFQFNFREMKIKRFEKFPAKRVTRFQTLAVLFGGSQNLVKFASAILRETGKVFAKNQNWIVSRKRR